MQHIVTLLIAILIFGLIIGIHEFGHFIVAKLNHIQVNQFAIGMGPKILHFQKGDTEYSLRLFPIGGFCAVQLSDLAVRLCGILFYGCAVAGFQNNGYGCGDRRIQQEKPPLWRGINRKFGVQGYESKSVVRRDRLCFCAARAVCVPACCAGSGACRALRAGNV